MQEEPARSALRAKSRLLALLLLLPILSALTAVYTLDHTKTQRSLLAMTNLVGPTTRSLLEGKGLTVCTEDMGTRGNPICFHAARMPATAATVALGFRLFGDLYLRVAVFKTLLLLLPLELAIFLVWKQLPRSRGRTLAMVLLLLAPFAIVSFLADVSNMLVDEGYSYSFLALALAFLLFPAIGPDLYPKATARSIVFALALDGLYLSKSSMLAAMLVLLAGFLLIERRASLRLLVLVLAAAAPLGWALHQHHVSGRYSFGTSLDGINLHKGNNQAFLENYPPRGGDSLDWYDFTLSRGLSFPDEWSFNDYHQHAALVYLRTHPGRTFHGDLRKLDVLFFSCTKIGSSASHGTRKLVEGAGLLLFRLIFWAATLSAISLMLSRSTEGLLRTQAAIFVALVAACALPYLAGFAYTRHVSILIYPSALFCCRVLLRKE
ncbi:MAG: hypothetical protein M3Y50_10950 [Acidobacteriota bacterium]|nr:hypothetical protein [Acidobacteriota bacterium]